MMFLIIPFSPVSFCLCLVFSILPFAGLDNARTHSVTEPRWNFSQQFSL